mmetsp:Transcript_41346/g.127791  ORF Transcript_41346/g.127791 Transcript_41346/m.127791 type:complete len:385 (-) Transcript_41346:685-1839(-)
MASEDPDGCSKEFAVVLTTANGSIASSTCTYKCRSRYPSASRRSCANRPMCTRVQRGPKRDATGGKDAIAVARTAATGSRRRLCSMDSKAPLLSVSTYGARCRSCSATRSRTRHRETLTCETRRSSALMRFMTTTSVRRSFSAGSERRTLNCTASAPSPMSVSTSSISCFASVSLPARQISQSDPATAARTLISSSAAKATASGTIFAEMSCGGSSGATSPRDCATHERTSTSSSRARPPMESSIADAAPSCACSSGTMCCAAVHRTRQLTSRAAAWASFTIACAMPRSPRRANDTMCGSAAYRTLSCSRSLISSVVHACTSYTKSAEGSACPTASHSPMPAAAARRTAVDESRTSSAKSERARAARRCCAFGVSGLIAAMMRA